MSESTEKLENHLQLLKKEFNKLQKNNNELQKKYDELTAQSGDDISSSFVSRLVITVASLYGRKTYSDVIIKFKDKSMPAHKFVLQARSDEWRDLIEVAELDWSDLEVDAGFALLRWYLLQFKISIFISLIVDYFF